MGPGGTGSAGVGVGAGSGSPPAFPGAEGSGPTTGFSEQAAEVVAGLVGQDGHGEAIREKGGEGSAPSGKLPDHSGPSPAADVAQSGGVVTPVTGAGATRSGPALTGSLEMFSRAAQSGGAVQPGDLGEAAGKLGLSEGGAVQLAAQGGASLGLSGDNVPVQAGELGPPSGEGTTTSGGLPVAGGGSVGIAGEVDAYGGLLLGEGGPLEGKAPMHAMQGGDQGHEGRLHESTPQVQMGTLDQGMSGGVPRVKEEIANGTPEVRKESTGGDGLLSEAVGGLTQVKLVKKKMLVMRTRRERRVVRVPRRFIFGQEATALPWGSPYTVRRPMRRGHLNVTPRYSLQAVLDDIGLMWRVLALRLIGEEAAAAAVLSEGRRPGPAGTVLTGGGAAAQGVREGVHSSGRGVGRGSAPKVAAAALRRWSGVLVVPASLSGREVRELVSVLFVDLGLKSVVVHQEAVAAAFGAAVSTACVVALGAQTSSVVCVDEGTLLRNSRVVLPFGGEDVSLVLPAVESAFQGLAKHDAPQGRPEEGLPEGAGGRGSVGEKGEAVMAAGDGDFHNVEVPSGQFLPSEGTQEGGGTDAGNSVGTTNREGAKNEENGGQRGVGEGGISTGDINGAEHTAERSTPLIRPGGRTWDWPFEGARPLWDARHMAVLEGVKERLCTLEPAGSLWFALPVDAVRYAAGDPPRAVKTEARLTAGQVLAPEGLFTPSLLPPLGSEAEWALPRECVEEHYDTIDDVNAAEAALARRAEALAAVGEGSELGHAGLPGLNGAASGSGGGHVPTFGRTCSLSNVADALRLQTPRKRQGAEWEASSVPAAPSTPVGFGISPLLPGAVPPGRQLLVGLHEAVLQSVGGVPRADLQAKLLSSVLLVGDGASLRYLPKRLEAAVVEAAGRRKGLGGLLSPVRDVNVLPNRHAPGVVSWKGGVVLGVLDAGREAWLGRGDWVHGGCVAGSKRKYRESVLALQTQLLWYCFGQE